MASIKNGIISGSIGDLVYYSVNGKNYVRSKTKTGIIKSSAGTKKSASAFGLASAVVSPLLKGLATELDFRLTKCARGLMIGNAYRWFKTNTDWESTILSDFEPCVELNEMISIRKMFNLRIKCNLEDGKDVVLTIPEFNPKRVIITPKITVEVHFKIVLVTVSFSGRQKKIKPYPVSISIANTNHLEAARNISFPLQTGAATSFLVAITMGYTTYAIAGLNRDMKWLPAGVLAMGRIQ